MPGSPFQKSFVPRSMTTASGFHFVKFQSVATLGYVGSVYG